MSPPTFSRKASFHITLLGTWIYLIGSESPEEDESTSINEDGKYSSSSVVGSSGPIHALDVLFL
jgi:hypothetical protein